MLTINLIISFILGIVLYQIIKYALKDIDNDYYEYLYKNIKMKDIKIRRGVIIIRRNEIDMNKSKNISIKIESKDGETCNIKIKK